MKQWMRKIGVILKLDEVWYGRGKLRSTDRLSKRYKLHRFSDLFHHSSANTPKSRSKFPHPSSASQEDANSFRHFRPGQLTGFDNLAVNSEELSSDDLSEDCLALSDNFGSDGADFNNNKIVEIDDELPLILEGDTDALDATVATTGIAIAHKSQANKKSKKAKKANKALLKGKDEDTNGHNHLVGIATLTAYQKAILRGTWKHLTHDEIANQNAIRIYRYFSNLSTESKHNLNNVTFSMVKLLTRTIEHSMRHLEAPDQLKVVFIQVGRSLVYFDGGQMAQQKRWDTLALHLLEYCTGFIVRDKWYREALRAWAIFVSYVVDHLNLGYQAELKIARYLSGQQFLIKDRN